MVHLLTVSMRGLQQKAKQGGASEVPRHRRRLFLSFPLDFPLPRVCVKSHLALPYVRCMKIGQSG